MPDFEPLPRTDPTLVAGYRAPTDQVSTRPVIDMADRILLYQPNATPLLTITGRIKGKRVTHNRKFEWLEKDIEPRTVVGTAVEPDIETDIAISAGDVAKLRANDILRNLRTNEVILVSATVTTSFTAVRGIGAAGGGTAAAETAVGDVFAVIGTSYPDNSTMGTFKSIQEYSKYNYTQIFRTGFGFTGRGLVTKLFGGPDKTTETKWQAMKHKKDIEYAFIFGNRHVIDATASVKERTFTGGLDWSIQTNRWNVSGVALNTRVFDEMLEEGLRWGQGGRQQAGKAIKYLFHSSAWGTEINHWVEHQLEYTTLDEQIGFKAAKYKSPHGDVMLVPTPILDEFAPDRAFLLDLNGIDYAYLNERDTKLMSDREENDRDGEAFEYISDCGIQVADERSHVALLGLGVA
jgi:hypothetical protein